MRALVRYNRYNYVSTHSRPKAAAFIECKNALLVMCFNTQPPEGGCSVDKWDDTWSEVSTHSRPKAAAQCFTGRRQLTTVSTHSRPKAAAFFKFGIVCMTQFQHTAARRRLQRRKRQLELIRTVSTHSRPKAAAQTWKFASPVVMVSTHSRPKAAAAAPNARSNNANCFNTQPPEGGCFFQIRDCLHDTVSTHSRPKAAAKKKASA